MKALISPVQENLVVQVEQDENIFGVSDPLYWFDCPDYITAYDYFLSPQNNIYIFIDRTPAVEMLEMIDATQIIY